MMHTETINTILRNCLFSAIPKTKGGENMVEFLKKTVQHRYYGAKQIIAILE